MSWTQPTDVTDAWIGEGAPTDLAKVKRWIDKAEREVRRQVPDLQARITADTTGELLETTRDVVVAMVTRVFRNPEGIRQTNVTTGPFTNSKTYGGDVPGALELTADELAALQGQKGGAFSIDLIPSTSPYHPEAW